MKYAKSAVFLLLVACLLSFVIYSIASETLICLKIVDSIFFVLLLIFFVWVIQVVIDDLVQTTYDRRFPLPDNLLIFPDAVQ